MQKENSTTQQFEGSEEKTDRLQQKYQSALENFNKKQVPTQPPKKKTWWLSFFVLLVAIAIGVFLIIRMSGEMGSEQKNFFEVYSAVSLQNGVTTVAVLLGMLLLDIAKFFVIIHATTHKLRPLVSTKVSLWGRYYDNITPFASGGQPAQIIYLHGKGFSGGLSSAVVLIKYFFSTFAWLGVACVAMAANSAVLQNVDNGNFLQIAGWIGWGINMLPPLFILLFVVMPKLAHKLTAALIFVGYKLKIVKNKQKTMQKALNVVQDFRSSFIIMAKRPLHLVLLFVICISEIALTFAFPYFIIKMFDGFVVDEGFKTAFSVMGLNAFATMGASIVPTPGSSGAVEGLITMAFSNMAGSTLMWVTFTWRFAVFYLYIIIGLGITVFNFVRNIVRSRKAAAVAEKGKEDLSNADGGRSDGDPKDGGQKNIAPKDGVKKNGTSQDAAEKDIKQNDGSPKDTKQTRFVVDFSEQPSKDHLEKR